MPETIRHAAPKGSDRDSYVQRATEYCRAVVAGEIAAGRYVRLACKRQLNDLARQADEAWLFRFDEEKAARICRFIELLPHVKGPLIGEKIRLEPWQLFVLTSVFGWVRKTTGERRFRRVTIFAPRGNGLTTIESAVGIYCAFADDAREADADFGFARTDVLSFGPNLGQAEITVMVARQMLREAPVLSDRMGVQVLRHSMRQPATRSTIEARCGRTDMLDGISPSLAMVGHLRGHRNRELLDHLKVSTSARPNQLLWVGTVAGLDRRGPCRDEYTTARQLLTGRVEADAQFAVIWEADRKDDPAAESTWRKSNPNLGVSVDLGLFREVARRAEASAEERTHFLANHLGRWPARTPRKRERRAA